MLLHLQTWEEVEAYLRNAKGIVVPIGSTEQHGPNGLIGTDAICAEAIATGVGEAAGALVGPTINVGNAQHHLAFAGTITLRPSTLIAVIGDYVASLARHGFARFYFINGHGGNIATIGAAFAEIYADASLRLGGNAPPVRCMLKNWWETPGVSKLSKELYGDQAARDGAARAARARLHRRRGLPPPLPRRPHRLRPDPRLARARRQVRRGRGARHRRGIPAICGAGVRAGR